MNWLGESDTNIEGLLGMNKYIFLDFDGILNSIRTVVADQKLNHALAAKRTLLVSGEIDTGFDPIAVALIHRLATITNSKIVISSSWRYTFGLEDLRKMFYGHGWENADELIIGMTPRSDRGHRGTEIKMWLDSHAKNPCEYVIIDDSTDMTDYQKEHHFVKIDDVEGFLFRDYIRCLEILKYDDIESERFY